MVMKNDLFNQTLMRKYSNNFKFNSSNQDHILKHIEKLEEGQFESEVRIKSIFIKYGC